MAHVWEAERHLFRICKNLFLYFFLFFLSLCSCSSQGIRRKGSCHVGCSCCGRQRPEGGWSWRCAVAWVGLLEVFRVNHFVVGLGVTEESRKHQHLTANVHFSATWSGFGYTYMPAHAHTHTRARARVRARTHTLIRISNFVPSDPREKWSVLPSDSWTGGASNTSDFRDTSSSLGSQGKRFESAKIKSQLCTVIAPRSTASLDSVLRNNLLSDHTLRVKGVFSFSQSKKISTPLKAMIFKFTTLISALCWQ